MKKIHGLWSLFAALLLCSSIEVHAAAKMGVVDMQKALMEVKRGKSAKAQLEKAFDAKRKEFDKEQAEIKKESENFQKNSAALSEKARMEKGMKLQGRIATWQENVQKSQAEIQGKEAEFTRPILDGLKNFIPEIARARNLEAVFEAQTGGLLWALDKTDITEELIKKYDEKNP